MQQLNESQRVDSLHRLSILDTPREAAFDGLVAAAAAVCEVPISLISLIDTDRQWFKAKVGLDGVDQTPRSMAFCDYTIQSDCLLQVPDASVDHRVQDNPLVTGEQESFRFYAGYPLRLNDGARVGTLCVIDRMPRALDQKQQSVLAGLAQVAVTLLDARFGDVDCSNDQLQQQTALQRSQRLLAQTGMLANVGGWELDLATDELCWTDQTCIIHGFAPGHRPIAGSAISFYAPEARPVITRAVRHAIKTGEGWDLELPFIRADNKRIWVRSQGTAVREGKRSVRLIGAIQDISEQTQQRQALEQAHERITIATRNGRIGVWDWNVVDNELSWSAEMFELYGVDGLRDKVSYDLWHRCVHPDDREAAAAELQLAIQHHDSVDCEFRVQWPNGSTRYLRSVGNVKRDSSGKVTRVLGVNWDVTPLRKLSNELVEQHELLRITLQSIGDAIVTTDASGEVSWMNPVAEKMTGWSVSAATGRSLNDIVTIIDSDSREPLQNPIDTCLISGGGRLSGNAVLQSRDGVEYAVKETAAPIRNHLDEVLGAVLVFHDVTETRRLSDEMSFHATHDSLTGLFNRTEFEVQLESRLQHNTAQQGGALMVINLDQFKLVNDACGHTVGDQLLFKVAQLLRQCVRGSDTLARLGADEFAVLLDDCNTSSARCIAQRICESVDEYRFIHNGQRFRIGASIGLVPFDCRWQTIAAAMQAADVSCHAAKESGRNRVHEWHDRDEQIQARHDDMQWASRLETAIDENHFVLYAQRIGIAAGQSDGIHAEVLIRLRDHDGQLVSPNAFFPAAERFHLCTRIDRWVLNHAIDHLHAMPDLSDVHRLCVNLSGQSVGDREFHRQAIELLKDAGTGICQRICLEITETVAVTNITDASVFVSQVRELGVRVALDDFGAGASSFGYLRMLDVDILKIDGQFITGMINDKLNAAAVRCFVDVATTLGLSTVAEFVNSPEILERIQTLGIDYAQGYLLHKPAPMAEVLSPVTEAGGVELC